MPAQCIGRDPGVFEGFPAELEDQPLLRVHLARFPRRDGKQPRVEPVDVRQVAAPAWQPGPVGVVPTGGHVADGVDTVAQQVPEPGGTSGAGK